MLNFLLDLISVSTLGNVKHSIGLMTCIVCIYCNLQFLFHLKMTPIYHILEHGSHQWVTVDVFPKV